MGRGFVTGRMRLGVTGHRGRSLPGADAPLLDGRVDGVLAGLAELRIRELVSPLAEGADRIVARRALEAEWVLRALLPFEVARYEEDFLSTGSNREFRGLVDRAAGVEVLPEETDLEPDLPYRRVGEALLDRVGVLVAVWDGEPPRGPGGTAEVVERAAHRGIPVIWIHSSAPHGVRLLEPGIPGARTVAAPPAASLPSLLGRRLGDGAP